VWPSAFSDCLGAPIYPQLAPRGQTYAAQWPTRECPCHPLAERVKWHNKTPAVILCIPSRPMPARRAHRALWFSNPVAPSSRTSHPSGSKAQACRRLPRPSPWLPTAAPENPLFPVLSKCKRLKKCSRTTLWLRSPGDPTRGGSRRGRNELPDSRRDRRPGVQSTLWFFQQGYCSRRAPSHGFSYPNELVTSNSLRSLMT